MWVRTPHMAAWIEFAVFTVGPAVVMGAVIVHTAPQVVDIDDLRPVLLLLLLSLMTIHQLTEVARFATGTYLQTTSPIAETFESGANVLASVAVFFVLQQITDLRSTRAELQVANTTLEERSSMASVLNRVLRHNVRNGVTAIAGFADHLARQTDDEEISDQLGRIEDRALALGRTSQQTQRIGQLLQEGPTGTTAFFLPGSLAPPLDRVESESEASTIRLDRAYGVEAVVRAPSVLPDIVGDVVEQLVAANDGATEITVAVVEDGGTPADSPGDDATDRVRIVIRDEGVGLPETDIRAIENDVETTLHHAEGLSLWCLKWVVDRTSGDLDVRADGATIEVALPRADAAD